MMRYLSLLILCIVATFAAADNWSSWRGPEQIGVSRDTGLPETFAVGSKPNNVIWRVPYGGITTPIVQNNRVYIINRVGENESQQERVMCFDARDGKVLWEHKFNVFLTDIVAYRLGWTQMVGDPEFGPVNYHVAEKLASVAREFVTSLDRVTWPECRLSVKVDCSTLGR